MVLKKSRSWCGEGNSFCFAEYLKPLKYHARRVSARNFCVWEFFTFFFHRPPVCIKQYKIVQREEKKNAANINHSIKIFLKIEILFGLWRAFPSTYFCPREICDTGKCGECEKKQLRIQFLPFDLLLRCKKGSRRCEEVKIGHEVVSNMKIE